MKKFLRSRYFYLIAFLTLAATIIPTVLCSMGLTPVLRNGVNTLLTPLRQLSYSIVEGIDGYAEYVYAFDEMMAENERLKAENATLKEELHKSLELEEQYRWISEYLELKMQRTELKFTAASVCGRESGNYSSVFMIDVGTSDGIEKNMPVLSDGVLLGYVSSVGTNWAKVTSVLESSASVGVYDERSGEMAVMAGDYNLSKEGLCRLQYLEEGADVRVGDRILTGGYGSVYPRGLIIGYVEKIELDEFSRSMVAYVRPEAFNLADENKISDVMVVVEYETYTENEYTTDEAK